MSCLSNPKPRKPISFLGITWYRNPKYGPHDMRLRCVSTHMRGYSDDFKTIAYCKHCHKKSDRHFVQWEDLQKVGFTPTQLRSVLEHSGDDIWFTEEEAFGPDGIKWR